MKGENLENVKIGIILCDCEENISDIINMEKAVMQAERLPGVVRVIEEKHLCSEEGLTRIKEEIKKHFLDRLVIAACGPKSSIEPIFYITFHQAGLNPYLVEWVNVREQCAWVHSDDPGRATEKAINLIKMGVARNRFAKPLRLPLPEINNEKCIRCAICEKVCPSEAVEIHKAGTYLTKIKEFLCNCCGICSAACPAAAIEMPRHIREQLSAQIDIALAKQ